ncbi:iron-only hydrogenase maturation protein HydF [Thermosyntropha lipolytica DSM 11003]|uniref:Iron-only hydrogenase maturation protein HydF n=1 Tax=Thermosyntropha lipolytica DSM 11003 TaxID=1123382 RepID=A0A1M5N258_9FIRM|nr:[FeFe] hydrogenase H-cluster maturation GTPase HydF [Thermosyntropha lipolytica]SHG83611.1 iron-only hydrogenase maturation protein HydF [Thermosyntropha lipolytica DSM 11003]
MQETPRANRLHIAIFGRRNAGKSSLINAITGQDIALVSDKAGTTTDPVYKAMEILPLGPCVLIDTAGIDDEGELGVLRIKKTREVLDKTDLALLVIDPLQGISTFELELVEEFRRRNIPFIPVINKIDQATPSPADIEKEIKEKVHLVSAVSKEGIDQLKELIALKAPSDYQEPAIIGDLLQPGDMCILVTPIDSAAPKGRLILPQVQTIRDILDHDSQALVVKETELAKALASLKNPPRIVITDSQAFKEVERILDPSIPLTSFSILYARYKGDLKILLAGIEKLKEIKPGDKILIAEACTHHRQQDDIGTVKIPRLLEKIAGGKLDLHWSSGSGYPENLSSFELIIHCGGCMLNRRQMLSRINKAREKGVPITNYGLFLAYANGILERALAPLVHKL